MVFPKRFGPSVFPSFRMSSGHSQNNRGNYGRRDNRRRRDDRDAKPKRRIPPPRPHIGTFGLANTFEECAASGDFMRAQDLLRVGYFPSDLQLAELLRHRNKPEWTPVFEKIYNTGHSAVPIETLRKRWAAHYEKVKAEETYFRPKESSDEPEATASVEAY